MDEGTSALYKHIMSLNNIQLQAIIAKKLGYRPTVVGGIVKVYVKDDMPEDVIAFLPNWPLVIKDAFDLEDEISEIEQSSYANVLSYVVTEDRLSQGCIAGNHFHLLHATARQRCMAWIIHQELKHWKDLENFYKEYKNV